LSPVPVERDSPILRMCIYRAAGSYGSVLQFLGFEYHDIATFFECANFWFGAALRFFGEHLLDVRTKHFRQFAIDSRCAGEYVAGFKKVLAAIKAGDNSSSFANDQRTGSNVP
jgi:hypothetical protein